MSIKKIAVGFSALLLGTTLAVAACGSGKCGSGKCGSGKAKKMEMMAKKYKVCRDKCEDFKCFKKCMHGDKKGKCGSGKCGSGKCGSGK